MNLKISTKLLIIILVTIVFSLLFNSYIYYSNLKKEYLNDIYKNSTADIKIVNDNIKQYMLQLEKIALNIAQTKDVQAALNLISNYQDAKNYDEELFDVEKKALLDFLSSRINIADNYSFGIIDKNMNPVVISGTAQMVQRKGIFTYRQGKPYFLDTQNNTLREAFKIYDLSYDLKLQHTILLEKESFSIRSTVPIYGYDDIVGYFRIKKVFNNTNFQVLLKNIDYDFAFLSDNLSIATLNLKLNELLKSTSIPLEKAKHHPSELVQDDNFIYHSHTIDVLENKKLYLVSVIDKKILAKKIDTLISQLALSILLATLFAFILVSVYLKKDILKKLDILTRAIKKLQSKDYSKIEYKSNDEIGLVIREFNNLTAQLNDSVSKIENLNNFLQRILDSVPVRIFWKDVEGKYLGCNKLFVKDTGYSSVEEVVGKNDLQMPWGKKEASGYTSDDKEVIFSNKAKLLIQEEQTTPNGEIIYLLTSKVPLTDEKEKVIGILGIYEDITVHKLMEEKLKNQELVVLEQSKMAAMGEMLESIAHQWRQPLSVITTSASSMDYLKKLDMLSDEQLFEMVKQIENSALHLSQTIDDFRDFYKNDRTAKYFNLKRAIEKSKNLIVSKLKNRNIEVLSDFEDVEVLGYENEIIQVFMNIFNNAIDAFDEKKQEEKIIRISVIKNEKSVTVSFQDNAGGIPQEIINKVFDRKFTTKENKNGTGIGLYMSKLIMEKSNGKIEAFNDKIEVGDKSYLGACFIITLPVDKVFK